jgi:hypothetical protein
MVKFNIFAGGYASVIASYLFDSDASTLTFQKNFTTGNNPSWIVLHPTNQSVL